jgi:hypothetical protein
MCRTAPRDDTKGQRSNPGGGKRNLIAEVIWIASRSASARNDESRFLCKEAPATLPSATPPCRNDMGKLPSQP